MGRKEKKPVSITYLRNKKFRVITPLPGPAAGSALLVGSGVGNLQRCLLCSKARGGCLLSLTYGSKYLTARAYFVLRSVEHFFWKINMK